MTLRNRASSNPNAPRRDNPGRKILRGFDLRPDTVELKPCGTRLARTCTNPESQSQGAPSKAVNRRDLRADLEAKTIDDFMLGWRRAAGSMFRNRRENNG